MRCGKMCDFLNQELIKLFDNYTCKKNPQVWPWKNIRMNILN